MKKIYLQKWGNSFGVRIPKTILETLKLQNNDALEINIVNNQIVLSKTNISTALKLKDYENQYKYDESWINMKPVGKEL